MVLGGSSLLPIIASLAVQGAGVEAPVVVAPPVDEVTAAEGAIAAPPPPPENWRENVTDPLLIEILEGRRRPGYVPLLPEALTQENIGALRPPPPEHFAGIEDQLPIPDRWRLIESLGVVKERWFDPYHQNTLKGDRPINRAKAKWLPIKGDDWFFVANLISDTVLEPRTFPIPIGVQTSERPGSLDVFGKNRSLVFSQTMIGGFALIKGSTAFKPPDLEYRITLAYNFNHVDVPERRVLDVRPSRPSHRSDAFLGLQEAFIDKHLGNTSDRYDFYSARIGIQPFQSDFRGFLFNDSQLGMRLFGNRDNNRVQYNLAAFWRLEKDSNSGLNDVTQTPRKDYIFTGNIYRQDLPFVGMTSQISVTYNMNREKNDVQIDHNGFPVRPALIGNLRGREYDVVYLGYSADGRIGRMNLTASLYAALGEDRDNIFTGRPAQIRAGFAAAEASYDVDWMRFRLSGLFASGDANPYDDTQRGFDAIFENPIFGGADTSYWIRQTIPFAGGGRVINMSGRNGLLNNLRSSKEEGQSNFVNPGTVFVGLGGDFDLSPQLRVSTNFNHLWFETTEPLEVLRMQGAIPKDIGYDLSLATIWRPKATQNIVGRLSGAVLLPGGGFKTLFENEQRQKAYVSILANLILSY